MIQKRKLSIQRPSQRKEPPEVDLNNPRYFSFVQEGRSPAGLKPSVEPASSAGSSERDAGRASGSDGHVAGKRPEQTDETPKTTRTTETVGAPGASFHESAGGLPESPQPEARGTPGQNGPGPNQGEGAVVARRADDTETGGAAVTTQRSETQTAVVGGADQEAEGRKTRDGKGGAGGHVNHPGGSGYSTAPAAAPIPARDLPSSVEPAFRPSDPVSSGPEPSGSPARKIQSIPAVRDAPRPEGDESARNRSMVIKLPREASDKLDMIKDMRGGFKSTVALDILERELFALAKAHEADRLPVLPTVKAGGQDRKSLSILLTPELASSLDYIAKRRRAVKHQIILRVLIPGIDRAYDELFES